MDRKKVLVVEDDRDLRRGMSIRLNAAGYTVITAEDGLGAVTRARVDQPDVVLLDLGLPAGDGLTVLERYANMPALSDIPVVVLTGRDPIVAEPAVRRLGVAGFLRKPATNDQLLATIERAVRGEAAGGGTAAP